MTIYFVRLGAPGGPIKIGYAKDVRQRMATLCSASPAPLTLLATCEGDRHEEKQLHRLHRADRQHGEWFKPSEAVLTTIDIARSGGIAAVLKPRARMDAEEAFRLGFCEAMRLARKERGISLRDAAKALGVSVEAMTKYENRTPLPHRFIAAACALYGVTIADVFDRAEGMAETLRGAA